MVIFVFVFFVIGVFVVVIFVVVVFVVVFFVVVLGPSTMSRKDPKEFFFAAAIFDHF